MPRQPQVQQPGPGQGQMFDEEDDEEDEESEETEDEEEGGEQIEGIIELCSSAILLYLF